MDGPPPIRYVASADGVRLAYWTMGEGPPVIWLQELGFSHLSLEWELPRMEETYLAFAERHQLIRIDLRNQGLSSRGVRAVSDADLVTDILTVMERLGIARSSFWTTNGRARLAIVLGALHPERVDKLMLFSPWLGRGEAPLYIHTLTALFPMARSDWRLYTQLAATAIVGLEEPLLTATAAKLHFLSVDSADYRHELAARSSSDIAPMLERVRAPTLVLHREDERGFSLGSAQSIVESLPNGMLRVLPAVGPAVSVFDAHAAGVAALEFLHESGRDAPADHTPDASSGFRTVLFTDVVASTPLLTQLRDAKMREVMHLHDAVMEAAVTRHGGRVVKTIGDAFMAEFAVPSAAVEAAIEAQQEIRGKFVGSDVPVQVRIGINAGEPIEEDGDLHGASVVIAKRLESAAESGGILVSDVVKQAVAGKEFAFEDRGLVELKGFDEPVRAWAVLWE